MSNKIEKDPVLSEQNQYELDEACEYEACHDTINDQKLDKCKRKPCNRHTASDF